MRKEIYFHVACHSKHFSYKYDKFPDVPHTAYSVIFKWLSSLLSRCLMYAKYLQIFYPALCKYYNRITSGLRMLEHKNTSQPTSQPPPPPLCLYRSIYPEANILLTRFHASLKILPRSKPSNAEENNTRINNNNKTL